MRSFEFDAATGAGRFVDVPDEPSVPHMAGHTIEDRLGAIEATQVEIVDALAAGLGVTL